MANQDTSIGTESDTPVDGIKGSNPGTQQPSGAHVDAGEGAVGGKPGARAPVVDQHDEGMLQPQGVIGAMGKAAARTVHPSQLGHMVRGKFNGSLSLKGKAVGVQIGCGAASLQHTSGH